MPQTFDIDPVSLGQRLTEARKASGLTQQQAAEQLGVSRPTLIGVEKGTRKAKPEEIVALAGLYRRPVHDLMRAGNDAPPLEPHLRAALAAGGSPGVEAAIGPCKPSQTITRRSKNWCRRSPSVTFRRRCGCRAGWRCAPSRGMWPSASAPGCIWGINPSSTCGCWSSRPVSIASLATLPRPSPGSMPSSRAWAIAW